MFLRISSLILLFTIYIVASTMTNPPWCEDNYHWKDRKGIIQINDKLIGKELMDKTKFTTTYTNIVYDFYSKAFSDTILEYDDKNNKKQYVIIKGWRDNELYTIWKKSLLDGKLFSYLSCQKQLTEMSSLSWEETHVDIKIPIGNELTISRFGTKYAKAHNIALMITYYLQSVSAMADYGTKDSDVFTQALAKFLIESSGRIPNLIIKLKNAKTSYDLIRIISDEILFIVKSVGETQDSNTKTFIDISNRFLTLTDKWKQEVDKNEQSNIVTDITKESLDFAGKKGFDALVKYAGLDAIIKGEEGIFNFLIASSILGDLIRESDTKPASVRIYHYKDVPYNTNNKTAIAVYALLANQTIHAPSKDRGYRFYPNEYTKMSELATMLINELLYDEYRVYQSNHPSYSKIYFLFNQIMKTNTTKPINDTIRSDELKQYLKEIFKYKVSKILTKKYGTNKTITKLEKKLSSLANDSFAVAKVSKEIHVIKRGETARVVFSTKQFDLNKIVTNMYTNISVKTLEFFTNYNDKSYIYKFTLPTYPYAPKLIINYGGK